MRRLFAVQLGVFVVFCGVVETRLLSGETKLGPVLSETNACCGMQSVVMPNSVPVRGDLSLARISVVYGW